MTALLILFVAAAVASASDVKKVVQTKQVSYQSVQPHKGYAPQAHAPSHTTAAVYHGQYNGKCGNDGFYYNDYSSFVMCSNGNAYIQPCAPGSKNSANSNYNYGSSYNYRDFCDVNLVDDGYTLKHGAYDTGYHGNGGATYGHNTGYGSDAGYGSNAGYGSDAGYGSNAGYGSDAGYGSNAGYGSDAGYGSNAGYGSDAGYGADAGYGSNADYGSDAGYGSNTGYGYNAPVQAAGYGSNGYNNGHNAYGNNDGYRGQSNAGYGDQTYGGSYRKTEYKT